MTEVAAIRGMIELDENPARAAMRAAEADAKKMKQGMDGSFKDVGNSFKTALSVAVVAKAGIELRKVTDEMLKLKNVGASAGEMMEGFAKSLPIIGDFYKGGRNIRELITGESAALERVGKEVELQDKWFSSMAESAGTIRDQMKSMGEELRRLRGEKPQEVLHPAVDEVRQALQRQINLKAREKQALVEKIEQRKVDKGAFWDNSWPFGDPKDKDRDIAKWSKDLDGIDQQLAILRQNYTKTMRTAGDLNQQINEARADESAWAAENEMWSRARGLFSSDSLGKGYTDWSIGSSRMHGLYDGEDSPLGHGYTQASEGWGEKPRFETDRVPLGPSRTVGEEVFGRRTVTRGDMPDETMKIQREILDQNKRGNDLLERINNNLERTGESAGGAGANISIVGID